MGCGTSTAKGREDYSTLVASGSADLVIDRKTGAPEISSPLVSSASVRPTARELLDVPNTEPPPRRSEETATVDPFASIVNRSSAPSPPTVSDTQRTSLTKVSQTTRTAPVETTSRPPVEAHTPVPIKPTTAVPPVADYSPEPPSFVAPPSIASEPQQQSVPPPPLTGEAHKKKKKKKKKTHKEPRRSREEAMVVSSSNSKSVASIETPQPSSKSGMRFEELYKLKGVLGTGAFSTVREGNHRTSTQITYAIKCVNRKKLAEEDEAALLDEVSILREMRHAHIIRLYDFFAEPTSYYLVMERMSGGELFDRIVAKAYYNEKEARDVCKILLEAIRYCHSQRVAHRDLKPENLLLLSEDDDSAVKIADFGFAKRVEKPKSLTTQCGTPGYVAPEILEGVHYDEGSDMWSVGVILYILLGGYPPFIENNQRDLFRKIRKGQYEFHEEYWGNVSFEAKELISQLLCVNPDNRLDAQQALENEWIRGDDDALEEKDLGPNLEELKKFNAKRKFKAAVSAVVAANKLQSLGKDFLKNLD